MFNPFKKKIAEEPKTNEELRTDEKSKPEVTEKPLTTKKPSKKVKKPRKPAKAEATENIKPSPQVNTDLKATGKSFISINEYSSALEIAEKIDKEIAEIKSALGEYLRQLDDTRVIAEKSQRLYDVVAKVANKKPSKEVQNRIDINGLEIVLDATALNELSAIESAAESHQQRLMALQKAREALRTLDQVSDTEGIKYLTLEKEGIPEQILLKFS